jgi:hypothetical protein
MKFRSAWSRGLTYGSIFGGAIAVFPVFAGFAGKAPFNEIALAGGVTVLAWGTLGFLAGFCSHRETKTDAAGNAVPVSEVSLIKRLLYRFVAGLLLSYIAGAIVCGIGFVIYVVWQGDILDSAPRRITRDERDAIFIAFCGIVGAEAAAICGCWLGALLAPGNNQLGPVAKNAIASSAFGLSVGGWLSGMVGIVVLQFWPDLAIALILAATAGAVTGIASAVLLRLGVFR